MSNPFDEITQALSEAKMLQRAADKAADDMAGILCGRLHHVLSWYLKLLKRELRNFNIHTGAWKDE